MKTIDVRETPADTELICRCGKRILLWHSANRAAHEKPECEFFTSVCEKLKGHQNEGEVEVIEWEKPS
jgi:hypothetical protein